MFQISAVALDPAALQRTLADARAGACVTFEGWVRNRNEGQAVHSLEYEAYVPLAESEGEKILAEARARGARGLRDEFGAFTSFVQGLRYGESPEVGDGKHRFGLSMPLWALATGTGDCDTRAVLLAALTRSIRLCEVHLVRDADHQHMLAAAEIPVLAGDRFVRSQGRTLVLVETTDEWPIGCVASRTRGERLQTLFLADAGARPALSAGAASTGRQSPQPIARNAPRPAPAPRTSARSMPGR